ncbi:MAG: NAD(P)/FAD-dependent oxidoreductase [Candidatus Cloacimonetes bacterium]|nr:NAD(P)/FAD-dependent oxidoreductase [Candidatus Cloacimonadota bacterium]
MSAREYDVVVVGAGPAGSITARFAAQGGAGVLMLERDREPGIPVRCAEGVSRAGIEPYIEPDERWIAARIEGARLHAPGGHFVDMTHVGTGYVLERRIFDTELANMALRAGAHLLCKADAVGLVHEDGRIAGVKYRHNGELRTVRCRIVVGADGVESRVGRWAGIDTAVALSDIDTCCQYTLAGIETLPNLCEFYFGNGVSPGGYVWIFPKGPDTANVGIGVAGHLAANKAPREYLDEFVARRFPDARINYIVYGGVPTACSPRHISEDGIMLVGDAARQVNPITGGGVVQGMVAGEMAGRTAAEAIKSGDVSRRTLKAYDKAWMKALGNTQRTMWSLKERFLKMDDERFNRLVSTFQKVPQEQFDLKSLFKEAIREDPKLVAEVARAFLVTKIRGK